jgi:hypothetical protein
LDSLPAGRDPAVDRKDELVIKLACSEARKRSAAAASLPLDT